MHSLVRTALAACMLAGFSLPLCAQAPTLDAARATRIAADHLAKLGPKAPYIVSVTLEKSALLNGTQSWVIRWSEPIKEGTQREIGVRVKMDGTMAHLVEDTEARLKRATRRPLLR